MADHPSHIEVLSLTSEIVSAYVQNHTVEVPQIASIVNEVYNSLQGIRSDNRNVKKFGPRPNPAVPIDESVTDDYIICLEDGKPLQMLRRHLKNVYDMTVEQYRERWGLPVDYPVVCKTYATRRSDIAKKNGLGQQGHRRRKKNVAIA